MTRVSGSRGGGGSRSVDSSGMGASRPPAVTDLLPLMDLYSMAPAMAKHTASTKGGSRQRALAVTHAWRSW